MRARSSTGWSKTTAMTRREGRGASAVAPLLVCLAACGSDAGAPRPVAKPAVATIVVISCLNTWNEFLMAMLFIVDPGMKTLPVGMIAFEQSHNTDYPALLAGLSLISVPTLLVYAIFNKQVIRGVIAGAVK